VVAVVAVVLVAAAVTSYGLANRATAGKASAPTTSSGGPGTDGRHSVRAPSTVTRATDAGTTPSSTSQATTTSPASSTTPSSAAPAHGPLTSPPLPAPGAGFNAGQVTAVGDSVMLDYQTPLQQDIPGANVQAAVSEQWSAGEAQLAELKSEGQLGAVVIVGLSTNGPITSTDFANMMSILSGASRVVFVTIHVDRPWQDSNNAVLAAGVRQYPNTVLADWYGLVEQNPGWLYSDGTHLPIDGPGAQALASLVAAQA
jgi:hypothetical protein